MRVKRARDACVFHYFPILHTYTAFHMEMLSDVRADAHCDYHLFRTFCLVVIPITIVRLIAHFISENIENLFK